MAIGRGWSLIMVPGPSETSKSASPHREDHHFYPIRARGGTCAVRFRQFGPQRPGFIWAAEQRRRYRFGRQPSQGHPESGRCIWHLARRCADQSLDIVVPPVTRSDKVARPPASLKTQAAADVVVADQLVAPKRVESEVVKSAGFQTLGVTWPEKAMVGDLGAQVRTRSNGNWSGWVDLEPHPGRRHRRSEEGRAWRH